MLIEQIVGNWNKLLLPAGIAGLIAAEQEQRRAARVKCIEDPQMAILHFARNSFMLAWRDVEITSA